jgi:transposase-like protein
MFFICPKCSHKSHVNLDRIYAGKRFICDDCGSIFSVDLIVIYDSDSDKSDVEEYDC